MAMTAAAFKGVPDPFKSEYADFLLWTAGINQHAKEKLNSGHERAYLRGIHNPVSLAALLTYLKAHVPNSLLSMHSMWVDRHPQAHFDWNGKTYAQHCEIGDLLFLIKVEDLTPKSTNVRRTGWILQGKTADDPKTVTAADPSTLTQKDLYLNHTRLLVQNGTHPPMGPYELKHDRDIALTPKQWSFLQICLDAQAYGNPSWGTTSPLQHLWPLPPRAGWKHGSLCDAILAIVATRGSAAAPYGTVLDPCNQEWTRLCEDLLHLTLNKKAGKYGAPNHHVTAFQSAFTSLATDITVDQSIFLSSFVHNSPLTQLPTGSHHEFSHSSCGNFSDLVALQKLASQSRMNVRGMSGRRDSDPPDPPPPPQTQNQSDDDGLGIPILYLHVIRDRTG